MKIDSKLKSVFKTTKNKKSNLKPKRKKSNTKASKSRKKAKQKILSPYNYFCKENLKKLSGSFGEKQKQLGAIKIVDLPIVLLKLIFLCLTYEEYLIVSCCCQYFKKAEAEKSCLLVPTDYETILEAYEAYKKYKEKGKNLTTIILGKGEHLIAPAHSTYWFVGDEESDDLTEEEEEDDDDEYYGELFINTSVHIVGSPEHDEKEIIVKGTITIVPLKDFSGTNYSRKNASLKHLTMVRNGDFFLEHLRKHFLGVFSNYCKEFNNKSLK